MNKKKELKITEEELERIAEIKNSKEMLAVCAGCTYFDEVPLNVLLDARKKHLIYQSAENWFKVYYKAVYKRK